MCTIHVYVLTVVCEKTCSKF